MIKWRHLLVWLGALAVLGGFVYFYEFKGESKRESAQEKGSKLFDLKGSDLASITLQRGEETIEISRKNGQWQILSPVTVPADQNALNDIVQNVTSASVTRYLVGVGNLAQYGLAAPKIRLQFRIDSGGSFSLDLGEKDFADNNVYAKASSHAEILLISSPLFSSVDKSLFDLRDRKPMPLDPEKITKIEFDGKGLHLVAEKFGTDWKILQPIATGGDSIGISSFLGGVSGAEVAAFVDHPDLDLKNYGLAPPQETLVISTGEGSAAAQKKILIGTKKDDRFYARIDAAPSVFQLSSSAVEKLLPTLFKLRDKKIVTAKLEGLQRIHIQVEKMAYEFEKANPKEAPWKIVEPKESAGKDAREWKFWSPLEELSAEEVLDPPKSQSKSGLFASPFMRVTWVDPSAHTTELLFSKPEKDAVWVKSSAGSAVFRLPKKKVEDYSAALKEVAQ
jgi:hypothetical protein